MLHKLGLICFRAGIGITFCFLQYALWLGDNGLSRWYELKTQLRQETVAVKHIGDRNTELRRTVTSLKKGGITTSHYAREKMYMIGEGEVFYRFNNSE